MFCLPTPHELPKHRRGAAEEGTAQAPFGHISLLQGLSHHVPTYGTALLIPDFTNLFTKGTYKRSF